MATADKEFEKHVSENYFIIDRIIDGDCNGKALSVGVSTKQNDHTKFKSQAIRWGHKSKDMKHLLSFKKSQNELVYDFEDKCSLILRKVPGSSGAVYYTFICQDQPKSPFSSKINETVIRNWQPISMKSDELDAISEFMK